MSRRWPRCSTHLREHFCVASILRKRQIARDLDDLIGGKPRVPTSPATYSLAPDELRAEANRLHRAGWSAEEVQQVLAVERRLA